MVMVHLSQVIILLASSIKEDNILYIEMDICTTILQFQNPLVHLFTLDLDHRVLVYLILFTPLKVIHPTCQILTYLSRTSPTSLTSVELNELQVLSLYLRLGEAPRKNPNFLSLQKKVPNKMV